MNIRKIYVSNLLIGLVFWYSIEKLFLRGIGLGADSIGLLVAVGVVVTVALDIPAGMLADRWSRRGLLMVSVVALAAASLVAGLSHGLALYLVASSLYAVYLVGTSGTYQALLYDELHEEGRAAEYSRVAGKAYAMFMVGAGIANIGGGLLVQMGGSLRLPYFLTLIPCAVNLVVIASISEPKYHKATERGRMLHEIGSSMRAIGRVVLLRSLVTVWMALTVSEVFKLDFSQLWMLSFTNSALVVALFWAVYAFLWALGSYVAHRLMAWLNWLLIAAAGLMVALGFVHSVWGVGIFLVQVVIAAMVYNLFETRIQHETPSHVRTSVLSVVSTLIRLVSLPTALIMGWLIRKYDIFTGLQMAAASSALALAYWLLVGRKRLQQAGSAEAPEFEPEVAQPWPA